MDDSNDFYYLCGFTEYLNFQSFFISALCVMVARECLVELSCSPSQHSRLP